MAMFDISFDSRMMNRHDHRTARYRIAYVFGVSAAGDSSPDSNSIEAFEDTFQGLPLPDSGLVLTQKGITYLGGLNIQNLRQSKRIGSRDLTAYSEATKAAEQAGFYIFDKLDATSAPAIFAYVHWSSGAQFGWGPRAQIDACRPSTSVEHPEVSFLEK